MNLFDLHDREIWVFGGAGYLGRAVVETLSAVGANVLCVDLEDRARQFTTEAGLNPNVTPATLDVRNSGNTKVFVSDMVAQRGVPYGMVNLTYASTSRSMEELTDAEFDEICHGGLTSAFLLTRAVGAAMVDAGRGSIVLFSSMYGTVSPYPDVYEPPMTKNPVDYGVTKAGIVQLTRYLAVHWGRSGVRCNCVSPGPFPNLTVQKENPAFIERLSVKSPLGRIGSPREIAGAVQFLLSDASSYMTGQNLAVDGGWTIW